MALDRQTLIIAAAPAVVILLALRSLGGILLLAAVYLLVCQLGELEPNEDTSEGEKTICAEKSKQEASATGFDSPIASSTEVSPTVNPLPRESVTSPDSKSASKLRIHPATNAESKFGSDASLLSALEATQTPKRRYIRIRRESEMTEEPNPLGNASTLSSSTIDTAFSTRNHHVHRGSALNQSDTSAVDDAWKDLPMEGWNKQQVASFVQDVGGVAKVEVWMEYAMKCLKKPVDGKALVAMSEEDFIAMGFKKIHALALFRAVRKRTGGHTRMPTVFSVGSDEKKAADLSSVASFENRVSPHQTTDTFFESVNLGDDDDDLGSVFTTKSRVNMAENKFHKTQSQETAFNYAEQFAEAVEKIKPKNLSEMLRLRQGLLKYRTNTITELDQEDSQGESGGEGEDSDEVAVDSDHEGKELDEGDEEDPAYRLTKHRKGFLNRMFRTGGYKDGETLLSWQRHLIKKSLLKCNRKNDKVAVQMFKYVMGAMGDRRTSKTPQEQVQRLILLGILSKEAMRDELFLHICKQTFQNPNPESLKKGWNLMLYALLCFTPTKHLQIAEHVERTLTDRRLLLKIMEMARLSKVVLELHEVHSARVEMPLLGEIEHVFKMDLVPVEVKFPFEEMASETGPKSMTVAFDPFMTVEEAEFIVKKRLNLGFADAFGLYEANHEQSEALLSTRRIGDVLSSWQNSLTGIKDVIRQRSSSRPRRASPAQRETEERDEDAMSLVSTKSISMVERRATRLRGKRDARAHKEPYNHLVFQAKLLCPISGTRKSKEFRNDNLAMEIAYRQVLKQILEGHLEVNARDVAKFAALQLQIERDGVAKAPPCSLLSEMHKFIPKQEMPKKVKSKKGEEELKQIEARVIEKSKILVGMNEELARQRYLSYAETYPMYGTHIFLVRQNRQIRHLPDILNIGIGMNGVFIQNPEDSKIERKHTLKEIVTWGCSNTKFILVIGTVVQQIKFVFKTTQGRLMKELVALAVKLQVHHITEEQPKLKKTRRSRSSNSLVSKRSRFGLDTVIATRQRGTFAEPR